MRRELWLLEFRRPLRAPDDSPAPLASPRTLPLLAILSSQSRRLRDSVSFDFGWKHRTGLHDWAPAGSEPPKHPTRASPAESTQNSTTPAGPTSTAATG